MPRSKTGKIRPKINEANIVDAANAVLDQRLSIREAATEFNVSRTTLCRHLKQHRAIGREAFTYEANNAVKKVFTAEQERELCNYLKTSADMHFGLTTTEARRLAFQYAQENSINYPPSWNKLERAGAHWLHDFIKRTELSLRKPQQTSIARSTAFNKHNVNLFFNKLEELQERYKFPPDNIYNLDETGVRTVHEPVKVVAKKGSKQVGAVTSAERGTNVTMICAINVIGNSVPPMFIFPRKFFKDHMLNGAPLRSAGAAHPSGWSTAEVFVQYLKHFISVVKPTPENKILLVVDNHESHLSIQAIKMAREHGIIMLTFPPHTSHRLQPLDRTVFGPFKKYYNQACHEWLLSNPGKPMTIYEVGGCVGKSYPKAFTPSNIAAGFRVSGIFPLDKHVFQEHEFLPSLTTDRELPGPSLLPELSTPSVSSLNASDSHKTPEQIRPFPKAPPRVNKPGQRSRAGKCRIVTDTPEKEELEMKILERQKKLNKSESTKRKLSNDISQDKSKKKGKRDEESSSSDGEEIVQSDSDSLDDVEIFEQEEDIEETLFINKPLAVGNFLVAKVAGKKSIRKYVAQVKTVSSSAIEVRFLKKLVGTDKFIYEEDTTYDITKDDILLRLPMPNLVGGTARREKQLTFNVDLQNYKIS